MTAKNAFPARLPLSGLLFGFFSLFSLFLILRNSDLAIAYMTRGLTLCARNVIPSLFPFMVLSELIVASGVGNRIGALLSRPVRALFGISGQGACAVVLGALCGFPVGARTAVSLYEQGAIEKEEAERILTFSNIPSSAFLISAVGVSLYGNRSVGIVFEVVVLLSSLLIGIGGKLFWRGKGGTRPLTVNPPATPARTPIFPRAVTSAASSMLIVCAYIVFFSSLIGCFSSFLSTLALPPAVRALVYGIFELSGGVSEASAVPDSFSRLLIGAFIVGWSGFSVHLQILSLCDGKGFSFRPYFIAKAIQGLLCVLLVWIFLQFWGQELSEPVRGVSTAVLSPSPALPITLCANTAFGLGLLLRVRKKD